MSGRWARRQENLWYGRDSPGCHGAPAISWWSDSGSRSLREIGHGFLRCIRESFEVLEKSSLLSQSLVPQFCFLSSPSLFPPHRPYKSLSWSWCPITMALFVTALKAHVLCFVVQGFAFFLLPTKPHYDKIKWAGKVQRVRFPGPEMI